MENQEIRTIVLHLNDEEVKQKLKISKHVCEKPQA